MLMKLSIHLNILEIIKTFDSLLMVVIILLQSLIPEGLSERVIFHEIPVVYEAEIKRMFPIHIIFWHAQKNVLIYKLSF